MITTSRFVTRVMNRLDVEGRDHLDAVQSRNGRGLLTFSNHVSLFDDPLITSNFVRGPYRNVRWVGADALNFFGSPFKAWFFTAGRSLRLTGSTGAVVSFHSPVFRIARTRFTGDKRIVKSGTICGR